jgi:hypothetical protein
MSNGVRPQGRAPGCSHNAEVEGSSSLSYHQLIRSIFVRIEKAIGLLGHRHNPPEFLHWSARLHSHTRCCAIRRVAAWVLEISRSG